MCRMAWLSRSCTGMPRSQLNASYFDAPSAQVRATSSSPIGDIRSYLVLSASPLRTAPESKVFVSNPPRSLSQRPYFALSLSSDESALTGMRRRPVSASTRPGDSSESVPRKCADR